MKYNLNYVVCIDNKEKNIIYNINELFSIKKYKTKDKIKIKIQKLLLNLPEILFEYNPEDNINEYVIDYYIYKLIYNIKHTFKLIKGYEIIKLLKNVKNEKISYSYEILLGNNKIKIILQEVNKYSVKQECRFSFAMYLNNNKYLVNQTIIKEYVIDYFYKDKKIEKIII